MASTSKTPGSTQSKGEENRGHDTGAGIGQKAQDTASNLAGKAQNVASNVADKAKDIASNVAGKADDALSTVGEKMSNLGGTIRERAPQSGFLGSAASGVASAMETGGNYLQEHGLGDMFSDLTSVVRRYPFQSLLVGFGVGFLFARATRG